jgi:TPP-dependent pyruvate/acetoin dehydrogenase alpha subunit
MKDKLFQPYDVMKQMLYIRMVEEAIAREYPKQEMRCPVHLSIGQEAVPVGISANLKLTDHVISAHRSHAHYLAKGGDLRRMLGELFGKKTGCAMGKGGSMHLIDIENNVTAAVPIVGSSISIGVGVGFGLKMSSGSENIAVVYFGDGATEEGVFAESLNFAALHNLPILFVCENNLYSVYSPLNERQAEGRSLKMITEGHGVSYEKIDGNDVGDIIVKSSKIIDDIRLGGRPVLVELDTYRWLEHCGPNWDDELGYRPVGELGEWIDKCPIAQFQKTTLESGLLTQDEIGQITLDLGQYIDDAFEDARLADFPEQSELFTHVYASSVK